MAQKKQSKGSSAGKTGRPAFSDPRTQIFSKFGGCDFQMSPRMFDYVFSDDEELAEQTDQFGSLMVVQNNARITPNETIETRQNIVKLFSPPEGLEFTGVAVLIGKRLYAACSDKSVRHGELPVTGEVPLTSQVTLVDNDGSVKDDTWTFLGYADDNLIGMTKAKQIWTGKVNEHRLENAKPVPDPEGAIPIGNIVAYGGLTISSSWSEATPFRVSVQYTLLNKFGPTLPSPMTTFYASKPTTEWSGASYVRIHHTAPEGYDITAVELYYTEGEWQEPNFLAHVNLPADDGGSEKAWEYTWTGYLYDTSGWLVGNLIAPTQNHTAGVPASMMASHDGQLYFWGGEPGYRIWVGGGPGNRFSVSMGTGGGFVDCEPGVGMVVRTVLKFKTQQGAAIVTALCDNQNSQKENRFNLVETNISLSNEQSAKAWQAEKIAGTVGCKSQRGAIVAGDGLYAVSRYGLAITTLTMEYNSQLRVQYVSDPIEPVFLKQYGNQLSIATLFSVNDILYMTFGSADGDLDNVIFCYDIERQAWWTYTIDVDTPILEMMHIDSQDRREGIGIITADGIYLLPTTRPDDVSTIPTHEVLIESAEISSTQPMSSLQHLSQLEFRFDHFIGDLDIIVRMIDQFGRVIDTRKHVSHQSVQYHLSEYVRIDQVVESYKVILKGKANMRLTHFIAKLYPKSVRMGLVWGFDSQQSHNRPGSIHRTFADYNDLKKAIIT